MIVRDASPDRFGWLASRVGCAVTERFHAVEAVNENGDTVGMVGFDPWWGNGAHMHFAIDDPAAKPALLAAAFDLVFVRAGKAVVIGWVPANLPSLLKVFTDMGAHEFYRVRDGWKPGVDMVVGEIRKEDCRYFQGA